MCNTVGISVHFSKELGYDSSICNDFMVKSFDVALVKQGVLVRLKGIDSHVERTELLSNKFLKSKGVTREGIKKELLLFYRVVHNKWGYILDFNDLVNNLKERILVCYFESRDVYAYSRIFIDTDVVGYREELLCISDTHIELKSSHRLYELEFLKVGVTVHELSSKNFSLMGLSLSGVERNSLTIHTVSLNRLLSSDFKVTNLLEFFILELICKDMTFLVDYNVDNTTRCVDCVVDDYAGLVVLEMFSKLIGKSVSDMYTYMHTLLESCEVEDGISGILLYKGPLCSLSSLYENLSSNIV